jgi:glycosyltransferase involved in cell wall biosynthesis
MKKRRLMVLTHDLAIGGLQQVVVNICKFINRDMFDVSVLCLRSKGEFAPEIEQLGIKIFLVPRKPNRVNYFAFVQVGKILRREKIEIMHTHNTEPFVDGILGALLFTKVRTIVHTDHARSFPDKLKYMMHEWVVSHFAYKIVGVSDHTAQNLIKYEKISPKKVMTIMNGIDGSIYNKQIDIGEKRGELGITGDGLVIGLGVRLTKQKGITYLLQAMPAVIKKFPDITLIIAGDGPLKKKLEEECIRIGVDNNVLFIGPRLDMPEVLKVFDLYVLPSLWEGLPMVLLEAMAARCPILATDVGGNDMIVDPGVNGSLVKAKDHKILSSEVIKLLSDRELLKKYSENSYKIFGQKFRGEIMTEVYEKLYLRKI